LAGDGVSDLWITLRELSEQILPEVRLLTAQEFDSRDYLSPLNVRELWAQLSNKQCLLVDLRPRDEYMAAHLPGARHVPYEDLNSQLSSLPKQRRFYVYCRGPQCLRAIDGVERMRKKKLRAERLRFSIPEWKRAGLPVTTL
jgi:rhodanese-related sulfurtransferase